MAFYKTASVESIASATFEGTSLKRTASSDDGEPERKSYYVDGADKLDIRGILDKTADKYKISRNPEDYIFEALRANTTNVPNENSDSFHRSELLRFDTRYVSPLGKVGAPVYMTYVGKPQQVQHKADNPQRARGVILDAHYNDDAAPLDNCPLCRTATVLEDARDESGIHCRKCGEVVKDEFVEILVAIDTKKATTLARGVQAGILNASSMGCNCASTVCNVCDNVARTTSQFCTHIRGASKGSLWVKLPGSKEFIREPNLDGVRKALKTAGYEAPIGSKLVSNILRVATPSGEVFEFRKAFEYCRGVEFEEISKVHKPADPKALTTELLKAAEITKAATANEPILSIDEEDQALIRMAQLAQVTAKFSHKMASAQKSYFVVRVNGNDEDLHAATDLRTAVKTAALGKRDIAEFVEVAAATSTQALIRAAKAASFSPVAESTLIIPEGSTAVIKDQHGNLHQQTPDGLKPMNGNETGDASQPGDVGSNGDAPSIEDVTKQDSNPTEQSPEEFGMLPPGADGDGEDMTQDSGSEDGMDMDAASMLDVAVKKSKEEKEKARRQKMYDEGDRLEQEVKKMLEEKNKLPAMDNPKTAAFAGAYGDFEIEVFADKAIVETAAGQSVLTVTASLKTAEEQQAFGQGLLDALMTDGLVRTAKRFAGVLDGAENVLEGHPYKDPSGSVIDDKWELFEDSNRPKVKDAVSEGKTLDNREETNGEDDREKPASSVIEDNWTNVDGRPDVSPETTTIDEDDETNIGKGRSPTKDAISDFTEVFETKMKSKVATMEERVRKLYAGRLEKAQASHVSELAAATAGLTVKFARALKLASRRAALNLEESPLKAMIVDSLTVPRILHAATGPSVAYDGIEDSLALHLVEAAWSDAASDEIDSLVARAAEIMTYDEKYLASAESDLAKQAAVLPAIVTDNHSISHRAASMREAALEGNLILAPSMADEGFGMTDKASQVRQAMSLLNLSRGGEEI